MKVIAWFAEHPVAANLLAALIVAGGLMTAGSVPQQIWPEVSPGLVTVTVDYPGANPAAIEESICARIEDKVLGLEQAKRVVSESREGRGEVAIELRQGVDVAAAVDEIRARVATILSFPREAEAPVVREVEPPEPLMTLALHGPVDDRTLRRLAEQIKDELLALPGVNQVESLGTKPFVISVEITEATLDRFGLSFDDVAEVMRASSSELAAGKVRGRDRDVQLRTDAEAIGREDFAEIPLITDASGTRVLLGDLATITDGFAEIDQSFRLDDQPVILLTVERTGDQKASELADRVKAYLSEKQLPEGLELTVWLDETRFLSVQLDILKRNGASGLVLVMVVLALFLRLRLAVWVAVGIPISMLGAVWWMPALGLSFNFMTLFGFLIVIGIVVDDAVVVGENIFRHLEAEAEGTEEARSEAILNAIREVSVPVLVSTLTTVAAFSPLMVVAGNAGQVMGVIPRVVILTLTFSLVECLLILPHHLRQLRGAGDSEASGRAWGRVQQSFDGLMAWVIERFYRPLLAVAVEWRYASLATAVGLMIITLALPASGLLRFLFFPPIADENVVALVSLPRGTSPERTKEAIEALKRSAEELEEVVTAEGEPPFLHVLSSLGQQPYRTRQQTQTTGVGTAVLGGHLGEVNIQLAPSADRRISTFELLDRWRDLTGVIPEAVELKFDASMITTAPPVAVQLFGADLDALVEASRRVRTALEAQPGVYGVADSFSSSALELRIVPNPEADALGLSARDIGHQVRQAFYGEEIQRLQRGRHETLVTLRLTRSEREQLASLDELWLRKDGARIPFSTVASVEMGRGAESIRRIDGRRVVDVTADVDISRRTPGEVVTQLEEELLSGLRETVGVGYRFAGEQEEQREAAATMGRGFLFALFAIYALLALPFRSYLQPLVVLGAVPFGLAGAFWGHLLVGIDLTVFSIFGVVALSGVIVNDGLVLLSFVNEARGRGVPVEQALLEAGTSRFRPIVLTSLTTFAGLTPLILEPSVQAQFVIPMAVSLGFGILFGTAIILILIPVGYRILMDFSRQDPPGSSGAGHPEPRLGGDEVTGAGGLDPVVE